MFSQTYPDADGSNVVDLCQLNRRFLVCPRLLLVPEDPERDNSHVDVSPLGRLLDDCRVGRSVMRVEVHNLDFDPAFAAASLSPPAGAGSGREHHTRSASFGVLFGHGDCDVAGAAEEQESLRHA